MKRRANVHVNSAAYRAARRAFVCRRARRRYKLRAKGLLPAPRPRVPKQPPRLARRMITRLTITGETRIERCLREAKEQVRKAWRPAAPPVVELYGTTHGHSIRRRYDMAVHAEFHRRLAAAGIAVES
jgi:hypothetical protein